MLVRCREYRSYVALVSAILFGYSCQYLQIIIAKGQLDYLFGSKVIIPIRILWVIFIVIGSMGGLEFVWILQIQPMV